MKKAFLIAILVLPVYLQAQINYSSPYSIFGIGDRVGTSLGRNSLIAGGGVALGSDNYLNSRNPASLFALDSQSVVFDLGVNYNYILWKSQGEQSVHHDGNLNYIGLALKPTKNWGLAFSLMPYSQSGYEVNKTTELPGDGFYYDQTFTGSGGINKASLLSSYTLFNRLSLGIGFQYYFGSQEFSEYIDPMANLTSYTIEENRYTGSIGFEYGINYQQPLGQSKLTIGGTFTSEKDLDYRSEFSIYDSDDETIDEYSRSKSDIVLPMEYSAGMAFYFRKSFVLSADYSYADWSATDTDFDGIKVNDEKKYTVGIQYKLKSRFPMRDIPVPSFFAGASYEEGYINIYGNGINSYSFTVGGELPVNKGKNYIRLAYGFKNYGTTSDGLIKVTTNSISLSFSLMDRWFIKRRFD